MPIYEYSCPQCGTGREVLHKISESPEIPCGQCEGQLLQRQVSAAAFRLKGGGWYETDFKTDGKRNLAGDSGAGAGATGEGAGKAEASSASSSDAAPAAASKAASPPSSPAPAPAPSSS